MELRKIVFTDGELRQAAFDYCLRANIDVPQLGIDKLVVDPDLEAMITLKFDTVHPADVKEVRLNRDQVAAALIRHCMEIGVPLPRNSQKILKVQDGKIALLVNINFIRPKSS